ncbi:hypothetical protein ACH4NT_36655 [Streptomyces lydicus]|uniref:hypothetical protein n=1 Tax=Streptomyces lydicus TaxID=47763 RepID=UPI0037AA5E43
MAIFRRTRTGPDFTYTPPRSTPAPAAWAAPAPPPEPPLTAPVSPEELQIIERVMLAGSSRDPYGTDQFLGQLFQRLGAASVLAGNEPPTAIPVRAGEVERFGDAVRRLRDHLYGSVELAEEGHRLLRRLQVRLGREAAVRELGGGLPVYTALPAGQHIASKDDQ